METKLNIKGINDGSFIEILWGLGTLMLMNNKDSCQILDMALEQLESVSPEIFKEKEYYEAILERICELMEDINYNGLICHRDSDEESECYEQPFDVELFNLKMREYLLPHIVEPNLNEQNIEFFKEYLRFHIFGYDTPFEWEPRQLYDNPEMLNLLCSYCGPANVLEKLLEESYEGKSREDILYPEEVFEDKMILPMLNWYLNTPEEIRFTSDYYKALSDDFYKFVKIWAENVPALNDNLSDDKLKIHDESGFQMAHIKRLGLLGELTGAENGIRMPVKILHHYYATGLVKLLHTGLKDNRDNPELLKTLYKYCLPYYPDVIYDYESYDPDFETLLAPVSKQLDRIGDVELYLSHYHVREENLATGNFDWNGLLGNPFSWPFNPELATILPEYPEAFGNKVADSESVSGQENSADDNNDVVAGIPF